VLLLRGCISLHACAVAVDDRAIALVGPAGSGKSTTAAAFAERGYAILAEDVVTLQDRGDEFLVQPGYPSIRLWPSSVEALYGTAASLPRLTPTWDKRYLDLTQEKYEFQQQPLPLAAIYLLGERQDDRAPAVNEIASTEQLMSLVANTYATYLMDKTMRAREFVILGRVRKSVPIKRVTPHSDPARIGELCQTIIEDFGCIASQPMER
jgi:ABC-type cobalamin/Fe3+-siderophores transport system ATPase subunit